MSRHFQMALMQVEKYRRRLELLVEGRLVDAMRIQTGGKSATAKTVDGMQEAGGENNNCNNAWCWKQEFISSPACDESVLRSAFSPAHLAEP